MNESVKSKIIDLVQNSSDNQFLNQVYTILDSKAHFSEGKLFEQLSDQQKEETLQSLEESDNSNQQIDHETFMKDIRKEFGWS